jgi:hypothetical protein
MKQSIILGGAICLLGSACAHSPRYVQTPCLKADQALPAEPESVKPRLTGKADEDVKIIAGSAVRLRAWGQGLRTILEGCRANPA